MTGPGKSRQRLLTATLGRINCLSLRLSTLDLPYYKETSSTAYTPYDLDVSTVLGGSKADHAPLVTMSVADLPRLQSSWLRWSANLRIRWGNVHALFPYLEVFDFPAPSMRSVVTICIDRQITAAGPEWLLPRICHGWLASLGVPMG